MFQLLLIFFIDLIVSVISSTQIAYDVMCVQYVQKQPLEVCWSRFLINLYVEIRKIFKKTYFEGHLRTTTDLMICNEIVLGKVRAEFHIKIKFDLTLS